MKLHYLGTAAAEGAPAVFCSCEHCRYARRVRGREVRTRSGALVDGTLKLDFGPDSYMQSLRDGIDYTRVHNVLITHSHEDHLCVTDLNMRRPICAHVPEGDPPLTVWGNARVGELMKNALRDEIAFRPLQSFRTERIEGYDVTPLQAVHCRSVDPDAGFPVVYEGQEVRRAEEAFIYLIEKDGKRLLYAHDTSRLTAADMDFLQGRRLDLVSLDCTNGHLDLSYIGHMGVNDDLEMRRRLTAIGAADGDTVFVANHFSHNGLLPHGEMEKLLPGFLVAYDGMEVEI